MPIGDVTIHLRYKVSRQTSLTFLRRLQLRVRMYYLLHYKLLCLWPMKVLCYVILYSNHFRRIFRNHGEEVFLKQPSDVPIFYFGQLFGNYRIVLISKIL